MGQSAFCIPPVNVVEGLGEKSDAHVTLCKAFLRPLQWQLCPKPRSVAGWSPEASDSGLCGPGNLGQD